MILTTIDKDGLLELKSASIRQFLEDNKGKKVKIEVVKAKRSDSQNSYYWLYLGIIERETGNTAQDLHDLFKRKFLPPEFKNVLGIELKIPASTTKLSKSDFGTYLDKICALTNVPLPNPVEAGYITNY